MQSNNANANKHVGEIPIIISEESSKYLDQEILSETDDDTEANTSLNHVEIYIASIVSTIVIFLLISIPLVDDFMENTFGNKKIYVKIIASILIANIGIFGYYKFT